jgi:hypothetical protein
MHSFYLAPNDWAAATLTEAEAHHARNVLRLQPGARVTVFDGEGREGTAEITTLDSNAVRLRFLHEALTPPLRARSQVVGPVGMVRLEHRVTNSAIEDGGRSPKPDVGLRVHPFEAQAVQYFLGAHVEPAYVDVRMAPLEAVLQQLQLIAAMR